MIARRRIPGRDLYQVLRATAPLWEEMRGQQLFLTGGTGFFGHWLLETFCHINRALRLGAQATVLVRDPERFRGSAPHLCSDPALSLHPGDVRDFVFPSGRFSFLIHAATPVEQHADVSPEDMWTTLVRGTQRTLEFAASSGARRFLLSSSGAVHGRQPANMAQLPETFTGAPDPLDLACVYAEGKRAAEMLCALSSRKTGLECAIARCWSFCGPHLALDKHFAIGNLIGDALAGRDLEISGDGTARRSYLYGSDLAIWLWTMLFRAPSLVPIHVGSAEDVSILELAETVAQVLRPDAVICVRNQPTPGVPAQRYVPSVDRAHRLLGLRPTVSLREAIARTAAWHSDVRAPAQP